MEPPGLNVLCEGFGSDALEGFGITDATTLDCVTHASCQGTLGEGGPEPAPR